MAPAATSAAPSASARAANVPRTEHVADVANVLAAEPAPTGAVLTVDGQSGNVVYAQRGGTQRFDVGDLLDMASLVPDFINASNPDPDFYNFNGWWTSNEFLVYPNATCSGQFVAEFYNNHMQPSSATDSASFSGAVRTYSVRASQTLWTWWLEASIDIVDTVDEAMTTPAHA
ncbi:MAG TPA: hypothetical protein PLV68_16120, partial [Ilumatobacteraceae bacterium]|nr:hypothetical protein [Ilumatobacteraceae bacterium]